MPPACGVLPFISEAMTDRRKRIRPANVSLRLKQGDRARLEEAAGGMSLNAYILWRVFDPSSPPPKPRKRMARLEEKFAAQALALLGQSRIPNNLNQLAKQANVGALDLTPEVLIELEEALQFVRDIRDALLSALRLSEGAE